MVPNFFKLNWTNVPLNSVVSVPKHLKSGVVVNLTKQLKKPPTVISTEDMGTLKRQHRHSMPAPSAMSFSTIERFDTEDKQDHRALAWEESVL